MKESFLFYILIVIGSQARDLTYLAIRPNTDESFENSEGGHTRRSCGQCDEGRRAADGGEVES